MSPGCYFGTRGYMCPHYNDTGVFDAKADIYSFGVVMAEVLTGRVQGTDGVYLHKRRFDMQPDGRVPEGFDEEGFERLKALAKVRACIIQFYGGNHRYCLSSASFCFF